MTSQHVPAYRAALLDRALCLNKRRWCTVAFGGLRCVERPSRTQPDRCSAGRRSIKSLRSADWASEPSPCAGGSQPGAGGHPAERQAEWPLNSDRLPFEESVQQARRLRHSRERVPAALRDVVAHREVVPAVAAPRRRPAGCAKTTGLASDRSALNCRQPVPRQWSRQHCSARARAVRHHVPSCQHHEFTS